MNMLTLLGIFIFSISAFAMNGRTTYQAKIVKPDGYPLEATNVSFKFTVLDPAASCVIYTETYSAINMTSTGGLISFALGSGIRGFPAASATTAVFENVFDNSITSMPCQPTGIYNPLPTHNRSIVMQFNDGNGWQTLPAMPINAVPYAMYANKSNDAKTLNGKADTAFVQNSSLPTCSAGTALFFNGASFSCVTVSSTSGVLSISGTAPIVVGGTTSAPVISITAATMSSDGYLTSVDYAEFKAKLAASSTQIVNTLGYAPVSGAAVTTQINNSNLSGDVSGTISSNSVVTVGGKSASQISTSVNDTLNATSSATADTIVKRNSSGNVTVNDIYANAAKINYVDIYKPSTSFNIRLQAPTSLSTNYVLNLPTTSGTTGQVLSTDGSGNLSWISPTTGSVVSVSATAPLASTGGSTPTISITQSSSSTNGYLSSADWNTFNNKQQATSSAIIATLGYTPADNAASGTYAQKANNLSDLTNTTQARSNLGLGGFATVSSLDLGSASATGILSVARLPSFSGDVTSVSSSNVITLNTVGTGVTSGTQYTKVTVDGKGRVTSGAQLSSSDVTTALGYTPANSTSGVTSLNGSTSQTQTFSTANTGTAFGITTSNGVHTFSIPLAASASVTAGLLSNADYITFNNKQTATSSAIIATLGYTPADNSASGTYVQKANNLSDLASATVARTNLGLGSLATLNFVDLGTSFASGTLAIARLPSFVGDATITAASNTIVLSNSGVTAGTYNKVTVDSKGRVTSSSALSSSDVTTALGYTPANSTSGVTSLNGSVSQTQTFVTANTGTAFGITTSNGAHTFAIPLAASSSVTGGLLSNTDYTTFTNKQTATSAAIIATLGYTPANATSATQWTTNGSNIYYSTGNIGVGVANPSAKLELASGTASVAPLKFTSGTLLSSAQSGTMEYDGFNFYLTDSNSTRRTIATTNSSGVQTNTSQIDSTGNLTFYPNSGAGSVIVSATTASTSSNTGAMIVKGGLGVAGNINTAGNMNVSGSQVVDGSLKLSSMTSGSVLFSGANGTVTQDNSNLYWDGANKRLGIGSNSPAQTLSVSGTSYFSGNVGIGTTAPARTLDVSGTAAISGRFTAGSITSEQFSFAIDGTASGTWALGSLTNNAKVTHVTFKMTVHNSSTIDALNFEVSLPSYSNGTFYSNWQELPVGFGSSAWNGAKNYVIDVLRESSASGATFYFRVRNKGGNGSASTMGIHMTYNSDATFTRIAHVNTVGTAFASATAAAGGVVDGMYGALEYSFPVAIGQAWRPADNSGLFVKNSGYVGIGTTSPMRKLQIGNDVDGLGVESNVGTPNGPAIRFGDNTGWKLNIGRSRESSGGSLNTGTSGTIVTIVDSGNVGIGTTAPSYTLHVVGTAGLSTGTAWTNASDIRLKDIHGDYEYGLSEVLKLHTVRYNYKKGNALGLPSDFSKTGFIAQEVQKVIPDAVNVRKDGYLELNVDPIHWAVVNAVKDLYRLVIEIKNEILGEVRGLASIVSLKADKAEIEVLREKSARLEVDNAVQKQRSDKLEAENAAKTKEIDALKSYLCSKDPAAPICK